MAASVEWRGAMTLLSVIRRGRVPRSIEEAMAYQSALFVEYVKEDRASQGELLDYSQESLSVVDSIVDEFPRSTEEFERE